MKVKVSSSSDFGKTRKYIDKVYHIFHRTNFDAYGEEGVNALRDATPVDSGKTRDSWRYRVVKNGNRVTIHWINDNVNEGVNIAIILQYGHATGWGSYVEGTDYVNPAMKGVFKELSDKILREVKSV
jgi:hypothetical protein